MRPVSKMGVRLLAGSPEAGESAMTLVSARMQVVAGHPGGVTRHRRSGEPTPHAWPRPCGEVAGGSAGAEEKRPGSVAPRTPPRPLLLPPLRGDPRRDVHFLPLPHIK